MEIQRFYPTGRTARGGARKGSGIGEVRAAAIVEARPFTSVEDLLGVHGIGPKTIEALNEYVTVDPVE